MLSREVIESEQDISVLLQAFCDFRVFRTIGSEKPIKCLIRIGFRLGAIDFPQRRFGLRLPLLRQFVEDIGSLMHPAALFLRGRPNLRQGFPEAQGTIPNGLLWIILQSLVLGLEHQCLPTQFGFSVARFQA